MLSSMYSFCHPSRIFIKHPVCLAGNMPGVRNTTVGKRYTISAQKYEQNRRHWTWVSTEWMKEWVFPCSVSARLVFICSNIHVLPLPCGSLLPGSDLLGLLHLGSWALWLLLELGPWEVHWNGDQWVGRERVGACIPPTPPGFPVAPEWLCFSMCPSSLEVYPPLWL